MKGRLVKGLYLSFEYVKNNSLIFRLRKEKKVDDFKSYFEKKKVCHFSIEFG